MPPRTPHFVRLWFYVAMEYCFVDSESYLLPKINQLNGRNRSLNQMCSQSISQKGVKTALSHSLLV